MEGPDDEELLVTYDSFSPSLILSLPHPKAFARALLLPAIARIQLNSLAERHSHSQFTLSPLFTFPVSVFPFALLPLFSIIKQPYKKVKGSLTSVSEEMSNDKALKVTLEKEKVRRKGQKV